MMGVGPVYVAVIIAVTVIAVIAGKSTAIYSAFMFFCTGALLIAGNLFFLPLFFLYWIFMSVLMKCTEERFPGARIFWDWFLLTKSHFYQHYYPETDSCAGYHRFGFNRKEQFLEEVIAADENSLKNK